jgi:hypothetical protein
MKKNPRSSLMTRLSMWQIAFVILLINSSIATTRSENVNQGSSVATIDGVAAKFRLINPRIRPNESLKVSLTLKNVSTKSVKFGLIAPLAPNVEVYDSSRRKLSFRMGSSLGEYPGFDVELQPGQEFKTTLTGTLGDYYDLSPGDYYLRFIYDLRSITNDRVKQQYMAKYGSKNVILWDRRWYRFSVKR